MSERSPAFHALKCWPEFYGLMVAGLKTFEYRKNDRDFKPGDCLIEREWCPRQFGYTGAQSLWLVKLVVADAPGLPDGYCIMQVESALNWNAVPVELRDVPRDERVALPRSCD